MNEVRAAFNISMKLNNLMIVPFGENQGKHGGVMLLVMMNKFCRGDDDKPQYEGFSVSTTPVTNKVF